MPSFQDGSLFDYAPKAYVDTTKITPKERMFAPVRRKQKQALVTISDDENILLKTAKRLKVEHERSANESCPQRIETNGVDLAYTIRRHAKANLPIPEDSDAEGEEDELKDPAHPGLLEVYRRLPEYLTPLDIGGYEGQTWAQKYAPQRAEHVLQGGNEALMLRDWLKRLTVSSVDTGKSRPRSKPPPPRKRKKRPRGLNGFIVSSDEESELATEESNGDFDSEPKSLIRSNDLRESKKVANAILLSGPSGCGKTAAVYAAAKELGFDVFEVNAGDRRSGKDILEKVGEMSQTHHVDHSGADDSTKKDIESGKQSTLLSMFASKPKQLPTPAATPTATPVAETDKRPRPASISSAASIPAAKKPKPEIAKQERMLGFFTPLSQKKTEKPAPVPIEVVQEPPPPMKLVLPDRSSPKKVREPFTKPAESMSQPSKLSAFSAMKKPPRAQKQSLIFIDEVDIRYDEDKPFWSTITTLINESKRPIILTCNDETLVPLDTLNLHAILRFTPPPDELAVDYLHTVAALEGHVLSPNELRALYRLNNCDLRQSLTHLNFWCQMGVGGRKSSLDWLVARWPPGCDLDKAGRRKRVIMERAYRGELELFPSPEPTQQRTVLDLWEYWDLDTEDLTFGKLADPSLLSQSRQHALSHCESYLDSLSVADSLGIMSADPKHTALDPIFTSVHATDILDHTGHPILKVHDRFRYDSMSAEIAVYCKTLGLSYLHSTASNPPRPPTKCFERSKLLDWVVEMKGSRKIQPSVKEMKEALLPISQSQRDILDERALAATVLFDTATKLSTDVAPYVRSIVSADVAIAERQLRQSNLLSHGGKGKRMRTTRASRSAQGWESRAAARPNRWFTDKLNSVRVLRTGGHGWQRLATPKPVDCPPSASSSSPDNDST